jgi:hypothetical protein
MEDNGNSPATKGDLADVLGAIRHLEASLLTAFQYYADRNNQRVFELRRERNAAS